MAFQVSLDSERIAESTANDGFAMMTIAVMTLLFLPATFFATLFAMPILGMGSENASGMMMPQMYLYVELAVSVTVVAFVIWIIIIIMHKRDRKRRDERRGPRRRQLGWQGGASGGQMLVSRTQPSVTPASSTVSTSVNILEEKGFRNRGQPRKRGSDLPPV
jgi:heme exporter protein D